ncbi:MAG: FlgD immunoglobulin-like domain containing protein [Armatimonadota bacterium]
MKRLCWFTPRWVICLLVMFCGTVVMGASMPSNTVYVDATRGGGTPPALAAHRLRLHAQNAQLARLREKLIQQKVITRRAVMPRIDTFVMPATTTRTTTSRTTYGNGTLTFAYENWTVDEQQALQNFLGNANNGAYQKMVAVYGAPASTATLTLVKGGIQENLEGAEFDPVNMRLTLEPLPTDFATTDAFQYGCNLIHMILHAFHAPAIIGYDAWEEGMTRTAATIISLQIHPDFNILNMFPYVLPLYDVFNRPELSTPTIFTAQGMVDIGMWRLGMAEAAWMKIYTEVFSNGNRNVFSEFNTAYYASYSTNSAIAGNLAALKGLVSTIAPTVEGVPFLTWYDQQYVMRPVANVGTQLYLVTFPRQDGAVIYLYYFRTDVSLDNNGKTVVTETPLSGSATVDYFLFDDVPYSEPSGNDMTTIPGLDGVPGTASVSPLFVNIGVNYAQRIRSVVTVSALQQTTYFSVGVIGDHPQYNQFYGTVIGDDEGTLDISLPGIPINDLPVSQGAYAKRLDTGDITFFAPVTFTYTSSTNKVTTYRRNIGPGTYEGIFTVDNPVTALTHTFPAGLSLVSFPIAPPSGTDPATLFGLPAESPNFKLAWWDPIVTGEDKYRVYPATPPITIGQGYWLNLAGQQTVTVNGQMLPDTAPRAINLQPGWNMVGNTFNAVVNPWMMRIQVSNTALSMIDAVQQGIIGPVWTYNSATSLYGVKPSLQPWEGGWVYNTTNGTITLIQNNATRMRGTTVTRGSDDLAPILFAGGWGVRLQAHTNNSRDTVTYLGVSTKIQRGVNGLDWQKPPTVGQGIRVAFIHPDRRAAGAAYASDIRPGITPTGEHWEFEVSSRQNDIVTLSWPDLRNVPARYQLVLEDVASGQKQLLRTTAAYTYRAIGSTEQPDTRKFRLTIEEKGIASVSILRTEDVPTRGYGIGLRVYTQGATTVQMDIRSITGRLLRTVTVPVNQAGEPVTVSWDGRGTGNAIMPRGAYMVLLSARGADGGVARRSQMVKVGRLLR